MHSEPAVESRATGRGRRRKQGNGSAAGPVFVDSTGRRSKVLRRIGTLIDRLWEVPAFERYLPLDSQWVVFGVGSVLIAVFVLVCGCVEGVAAKKKPQLIPPGRAATMGG